jgi:hypothetical protein
MNDANSFLISVESMEEATEEGHFWAKPNQLHLQKLMREVFLAPSNGLAKGRRARGDVMKSFSQEAVAELIIGKLRNLESRKEELKTLQKNRQEELEAAKREDEERKKVEAESKKDRVKMKIVEHV